MKVILPKRSSAEASRLTLQVKRLKTRMRNLQSKLAESVPKTELEALRTTSETKIAELEAKLAQSVPKEEVDALGARLRELEFKQAESIPRSEAEAELESASSKLRGGIEELQKKLVSSKSEADSQRAELARLEGRLAESISKAESESKVNDLKTKLSAARRGLEVARLSEIQTKLSGTRRDLEVTKATIEDLKEQLSQSSAKILEFQSKISG
jgi:uncharacterized coiled-coil protein SlyX